MICAVLGACLSCAQQEFQEYQVSPPPRQITHAKFQVLESENKVLKSLTFEKQTGEQLRACVDKLMKIIFLKMRMFI